MEYVNKPSTQYSKVKKRRHATGDDEKRANNVDKHVTTTNVVKQHNTQNRKRYKQSAKNINVNSNAIELRPKSGKHIEMEGYKKVTLKSVHYAGAAKQ